MCILYIYVYISKHVNKHLHTHILAFQPTHCCNKHCVAAANRLKIQIVHGWETDIMGFGKNTKNRTNQFVCVCAHYVCANSHITSALFEPLKCQKKRKEGHSKPRGLLSMLRLNSRHACGSFDKINVHFQWNDLQEEIAKTTTKTTIQSSLLDTCRLHEYKTIGVKLHMGQL